MITRRSYKIGRNQLVQKLWLLLTLLSWQCVKLPEEPIVPKWSIPISVPLADTAYYLRDILQRSADLTVQGSEIVFRPGTYQFDTVNIGDRLQLRAVHSTNVAQSIGYFRVNLPSPLTAAVPAAQFFDTIPRSASPIPGFRAHHISLTINTLAQFEYAHLKTGEFRLEIRNELPIPLTLPAGVHIVNIGAGDTMVSFAGGTIDAYGFWSPPPGSLANAYIRSQIQLEFDIESPGSSGRAVAIPPDSGLAVSIQIVNALADEERARFFTRGFGGSTVRDFILDDSTYLQYARFESGSLQVQLENLTDISLGLDLQFLELIDRLTNQPMILNVELSPRSLWRQSIDLPRYEFQSPTGQPTNTARVSASILTQTLTAETPITLRATDGVNATITAGSEPIKIRSISGIPKPTAISINDTVQLPWGDFPLHFSADSISLDSVMMKLNYGMKGGYPVDLKLRLLGLSQRGDVVSSMEVPPGGSLDPAMHRLMPNTPEVIEFSAQNGLVAQFFAQLLTSRPAQLVILGYGVVNPLDRYVLRESGTIDEHSSIVSSVDLTVPIRLTIIQGIFQDTVILGGNDTQGILFDQKIIPHLEEAAVCFTLENAVPLSVGFEATLLDREGRALLSLPEPDQGKLGIAAGSPEHPNHTATPIKVRLTRTRLEQLNHVHSIAFRFSFDSNNRPAVLRTDEFVRMRAYVIATYFVDPH